ncbi:MAG: methyltransferase domain-containing protein [Aaplasma endosymbiont of Hyalomma asiaticum]
MKYEDRVQGCFDSAAKNYTYNTPLQETVAERLCTQYMHTLNKHSTVLDVGCGTGYVAKILGQQCELYQLDLSAGMCLEAAKQGNERIINCDMNQMPFRNGTFDAIVSSMALHWASDLYRSMVSVLNVLKSGGRFAFSIPVEGTLKELQICNKIVGRITQHKFFDCSDIARIIRMSGARIESIERDQYRMQHATFFDFLASIVKMGSSTWRNSKNSWCSVNDACKVYNNLFSTRAGIFSSWHIAYFVIKK